MGCCVDRNEALVWECYSIQSLVHFMGIGCGAVGRAVVSETRDMWFDSSHQQFSY